MGQSIRETDYEANDIYGGIRQMDRQLDAYLAMKDPKGAKASKKNSSSARGQVGVVRQASDDLLIDELKRRLRIKRKREQARDRQRRRRERLSRKRA